MRGKSQTDRQADRQRRETEIKWSIVWWTSRYITGGRADGIVHLEVPRHVGIFQIKAATHFLCHNHLQTDNPHVADEIKTTRFWWPSQQLGWYVFKKRKCHGGASDEGLKEAKLTMFWIEFLFPGRGMCGKEVQGLWTEEMFAGQI